MGILSGLFGGSSSAAAAAPAAPQPRGPAAATGSGNVWRSVFDPGSNPNIDRVGSNYYDKPDKDKPSTTWEMILKAEDFKRRSFSDLDRDKDGFLDAKELAAAMPPSMKAADTEALIQQAQPAREGRLTRKEFHDVLDKYFLA